MNTDEHGCFPAALSIRKGIDPARLLILKQFWYLACASNKSFYVQIMDIIKAVTRWTTLHISPYASGDMRGKDLRPYQTRYYESLFNTLPILWFRLYHPQTALPSGKGLGIDWLSHKFATHHH